MMFLGYQNENIILTAETQEELENNKYMSFDKIIETDKTYTLVGGVYLDEIELRISEIDAELIEIDNKYEADLDTPVQYQNGFYYKPKWAEGTYLSLLTAGQMMPDLFPMKIWDATELEENAVDMTMPELMQLTGYLSTIQQSLFNARKQEKASLLEEKRQLEE